MIDLVKLRKEIKAGKFIAYVNRNKIYLQDTENGETIIIGELKEEVE